MGGGFLTIPNSIKSSFKIEKQKIKLKMNFENLKKGLILCKILKH